MLTLSLSAATLLALSMVAVTADPADPTLQHRHSFFSTLPVEPSDENLKVARHQVKVIGLNGFREWEVKGSLQGMIYAATGEIRSDAARRTSAGGKVHMQWYASSAPLLRPPFIPTFVPGFHLAVTSDNFTELWKEHCPDLAELVGGVDCRELDTIQLEKQLQQKHGNGTQETGVHAQDMVPMQLHHYVHKTEAPPSFFSPSSLLSSLISQQQSGSKTTGPALIDLVLHNSEVTLKVIWPVGSNILSGEESNDGQNTVEITFNEKTDKVVEVGWFYREVTEQENAVIDHFLGATVRMEAEGEVVSEALIQTRSSVFPPHKRDFATGKIRALGHGYTSTMTPAQTFHPHSVTTIHSNPYLAETTAGCELYVLQVLPPGIFVDPFQLEGLAPEIGHAIVYGETDLEKPVGVVNGWGSLVMVKVQPEEDYAMTLRWKVANMSEATLDLKAGNTATSYTSTVDIPMHMRYQPPVSADNCSSHVNVSVPWPIVAWTCPSVGSSEEEIAAVAAKKLFQIIPLPLELLFAGGDAVNFRFLLPEPIPKHFPNAYVSVPVGQLRDLGLVRMATFIMAAAGTLAVTLALIKSVASRKTGKGKQD
ncbi:protease B nonderepressible form [Mortierella alpina]|uniref:Protein PBN1 n=1 Tax=Mortierella alpina TaxID=64518 RepID=A0A9P6IZH8_MORAP|nr:protease B nonderepressible form [Mortierella alpina]